MIAALWQQSCGLASSPERSSRILPFPDSGISGRNFKRVELPRLEVTYLSYPRLPGCRCAGPPDSLSRTPASTTDEDKLPTLDTATVFEDYVEQETKSSASAPQSDVARVSTDFVRGERRFQSSEHYPLFRGTIGIAGSLLQGFGAKVTERTQVTSENIAVLASLTTGLREMGPSNVKRWAPTAGNLGSAELFIVNRAAADLSPGYYYYQADEHALARFRKRTALAPEEFMARVLGSNGGSLPDILFVFVGAFQRVMRKYKSFGYRLVHFDAGCAVDQLTAVAGGLGLFTKQMDSFADDLIGDQLNLRSFGEFPTSVVGVFGDPNTALRFRRELTRHQFLLGSTKSQRLACEFACLDGPTVTAELIRDTLSEERESSSHKEKPESCMLDYRADGNPADRHLQSIKLPRPMRSGPQPGRKFSRKGCQLAASATFQWISRLSLRCFIS